MTLQLTQDDVGKVYVRRDGYHAKCIYFCPVSHSYVFYDHATEYSWSVMSDGGIRGNDRDTYLDIIAEYKEPEVYKGWLCVYRHFDGVQLCHHGGDLYKTQSQALAVRGAIDAIYIEHTIGEK